MLSHYVSVHDRKFVYSVAAIQPGHAPTRCPVWLRSVGFQQPASGKRDEYKTSTPSDAVVPTYRRQALGNKKFVLRSSGATSTLFCRRQR